MRCTSLKTVGFYADGKTICWSPKKYSKEYATIQLPCGKCLSCRLESARQTAVRCVHEAQMHEASSFITLTYSDEHLSSPKLQYAHFQKFMKDLRTKRFNNLLERLFPHGNTDHKRLLFRQLPENSRKDWLKSITTKFLVVGEYGEGRPGDTKIHPVHGDVTKRPHWHALLFNYRPSDAIPQGTNERGDPVYSSITLDQTWGLGITQLGAVSFESAGYCARYASKKLVHGKDKEHDFNPIPNRSKKHAIGKSYLEKYWPEIFNNGYCTFSRSDGTVVKCSIPRYYEKWFQKHYPEKWKHYVTHTRRDLQAKARAKEELTTKDEKLANLKRSGLKGLQIKQSYARNKILEQKFEQLQKRNKL